MGKGSQGELIDFEDQAGQRQLAASIWSKSTASEKEVLFID